MYWKLIGSLMYLVNTRLDICFAVNTLSQFQVEPRHDHWIATKHIQRYLNGTIDIGLRYVSNRNIKLQGYTDADWVGSAEDKKSTSKGCFTLGFAMISWMSRKKTFVTLSIVELTVIYCDNQSCVKQTKNPLFHGKSKHIKIKYHFIRDMVQKGAVKLQYVSTNEQIADILTKPLSRVKFVYFKDKLRLVENASLIEREC
eukprot:PITA_10899